MIPKQIQHVYFGYLPMFHLDLLSKHLKKLFFLANFEVIRVPTAMGENFLEEFCGSANGSWFLTKYLVDLDRHMLTNCGEAALISILQLSLLVNVLINGWMIFVSLPFFFIQWFSGSFPKIHELRQPRLLLLEQIFYHLRVPCYSAGLICDLILRVIPSTTGNQNRGRTHASRLDGYASRVVLFNPA